MKHKNEPGFTLIEVLLYLGITSIIITGVSFFLITLLESRVKQKTISEVEQQGAQIVALVTQTIRNAEGINSPAAGASAASLSVDVVTAASDPTVYDLSSGSIRSTEGVDTATALHSTLVTASGLTFENLTRPTTEGAVRFQFTLTYTNTGGRNEYEYSKTFRASASLRQ